MTWSTWSTFIENVTDDYINRIKANPPSPEEIQAQLLFETNAAIDLENVDKPKGEKWRKLMDLAAKQIAQIILSLYPIANIICVGEQEESEYKYDLLALYMAGGKDYGTYVSDERELRNLIREYKCTINIHECKEIIAILKDNAPRVQRCQDENLIPVNNGIFNYRAKQLMPFSPYYVFLSKSRVDYNPNAANIAIHNDMDGTDWDVESWMQELSDDPQVVELLWQILGAIIRPNVHWNKSAWFYSESGNNGKGTLCALMRNLCGNGTHTSIPLSDFGKDFMLEPLMHASAIIVDENDVGAYIDHVANLKSIITNDVILINRKYRTPISYQFFGFMVQCLNELPKVRDRSESFLRRQLFVPFTKCFTGRERKYIKNDYLKRKEVLEYVLKRVLNMDYYELSEPDVCKAALADYKEFNDPIRQFMAEMSEQFKWDLVPFRFLYDLYKAWHAKNMPSGTIVGKNIFNRDIVNMLPDFPEWHCEGRSKQIRPAGRMNAPEPLIAQYGLQDWKNPFYKGSDINMMCKPKLENHYIGILRVTPRLAIQANPQGMSTQDNT